jgi:hypothetical protein
VIERRGGPAHPFARPPRCHVCVARRAAPRCCELTQQCVRANSRAAVFPRLTRWLIIPECNPLHDGRVAVCSDGGVADVAVGSARPAFGEGSCPADAAKSREHEVKSSHRSHQSSFFLLPMLSPLCARFWWALLFAQLGHRAPVEAICSIDCSNKPFWQCPPPPRCSGGLYVRSRIVLLLR